MANYNVFFVPHGDDGAMQNVLNAFIASHRVCEVDKAAFPDGWSFCVEWLAGDAPSGRSRRRSEEIDYREVWGKEEFERFSELRRRQLSHSRR